MIKKILKTEDGYNIVTDNGGKDDREYLFLKDVMCHNENEVIGTDADGNVVRINMNTLEKGHLNLNLNSHRWNMIDFSFN